VHESGVTASGTGSNARQSHYLKEVGDQWRTPDLLFWGINAMFGPLVLDLFADDSNAKCPAWYTAEDNALTQDWSGRLAELGGAAFANHRTAARSTMKQAITGMTHIMSYALSSVKTAVATFSS
jgi:phage N-6-adenine-methyltransferase